jgi:NADH-quinone oxidoreductase subunit L
MLIGAGLTAFYTFRMTWMVFFGTQREELPIHQTGLAMKISLALLSIGTFTTWLFFGGLNKLLSTSMPFHAIKHESTLEMIKAISFAPATWFALLVVALGLILFFTVGRKVALTESPGWLNSLTETSFGFESVNHFIVNTVSKFAESLRATQTGQLNWNILGIISALFLVLMVLLIWGGA